MTASKARTALLIDRDGVLVEDRHYVWRTDDMHLLPGVPEALSLMHHRGFAIIVVTNQSGVARGLYSLEEAFRFHDAMNAALVAAGAPTPDAIYICPHHPEGVVPAYTRRCHCRKPETGLITQAVRDWNIDLAHSWFVGDKYSDIECAIRAGTRGVQIMSKPNESRHPAAVAHHGSLHEWVCTL